MLEFKLSGTETMLISLADFRYMAPVVSDTTAKSSSAIEVTLK